MALVRKGSRRSSCTFAVEHADTRGVVLIVAADLPFQAIASGGLAGPVLPSGIPASMRVALRVGWTPTDPGSAFHLDQSVGFTPSQ
ncbi:hypothetical protein AB0C88_43180 [Streptomyces chartreusis]|uniref:hypothetical protein n=1 Tax=Streptomyces chartreusis TaxID=1969 RepID=UPI0034096604